MAINLLNCWGSGAVFSPPNSLAPLLDSSDTDTRQTSIDDASEFNDLIPIVESEEKHWDPQTKEAFNAFLAIFNSIKETEKVQKHYFRLLKVWIKVYMILTDPLKERLFPNKIRKSITNLWSLTLSMRMGVTNQLQDSQQHGTPNVHLIEQLVSNCITELKELSKPYEEDGIRTESMNVVS